MLGDSLAKANLQFDNYYGADQGSARVNAAGVAITAGGRIAYRESAGSEGQVKELILSARLRANPEAAPATRDAVETGPCGTRTVLNTISEPVPFSTANDRGEAPVCERNDDSQQLHGYVRQRICVVVRNLRLRHY